MSRRLPLLALLALSVGAPPARAQTGWQSLFDGKTTQGWGAATAQVGAFPTQSWKVQDGWLQAVAVPVGPMQDLRTVAEFRSFELEWEWRCEPEGNSGIKYLILDFDTHAKGSPSDAGNARGRGLEYQLGGERGDAKARHDPRYLPGALYGVLAPQQPPKSVDPQRVHSSRLVVNGARVEHWLDGRLVLEFRLTDPALEHISRRRPFPAKTAWSSPIVLQHHRQRFWFRNLRIRTLD